MLVRTISFPLLFSVVAWADTFDKTKFNDLTAKLKEDAFEFAREVERLYADRCSIETMNSCLNANFGECQEAAYPNQQCMVGPNYVIDACSAGDSSCSGLWDFSVSTVRFPQEKATGVQGNPSDHKLIESICFSRHLDAWFVNKRATDAGYWQDLGVEPRSMYFGSNNGAFRIFPARQSDQCGAYDPTIRPWYVAGSSGPKNVVLVLDTSGSMANDNRIGLLKTAAKRVVSTLTVSDRVLIVPFSSTAQPITDNGFVFKATTENKQILSRKIDELEASGSTNFYDGFLKAFDVLEESVAQERTASCNSAIIFLTDGENTDGPDVSQVTDLVDQRIASISAKLGKPVLLFTYSVSDQSNVHTYPKELACSQLGGDSLGLWSKITDASNIVDSLSSYYQLFALGLGSDNNKDFAAWVEPYQFKTGDAWGTTVSVPVYDRSRTPHLFLGVVGIDVSLEALDAALATKDDNSLQETATAEELRAESIRLVVESSDASCPPELDLSPCEMEAYRALSAPNDEGVCGTNCTGIEVTQVKEEECQAISDYPQSLFVEEGTTRLGYEERVCCLVGETVASDVCMTSSGNESSCDSACIGAAVAGAFGGVILIAVIGACCFLHCFKTPSQKNSSGGGGHAKSPGENPDWVAPISPEALKAATAPNGVPSEVGSTLSDDE